MQLEPILPPPSADAVLRHGRMSKNLEFLSFSPSLKASSKALVSMSKNSINFLTSSPGSRKLRHPCHDCPLIGGLGSDDKCEAQLFQQFLPPMIAIVQDCLDTNDKMSACQLFDVFETLLILEAPILSKHILDLVQFFMQCGANRNYGDGLWIMALNMPLWTVKY